MKYYLPILLLTFPIVAAASVDRDSIDSEALKSQIQHVEHPDQEIQESLISLPPSLRTKYIEYWYTKGAWRWDFDEWILMRNGLQFAPRYYKDDDYGSNDGWEIA